MQEAHDVYFGSLEAAARFGGRLGLRQQARIPEDCGPESPTLPQPDETLAEPRADCTPPRTSSTSHLTQWGRCGMIVQTDLC